MERVELQVPDELYREGQEEAAADEAQLPESPAAQASPEVAGRGAEGAQPKLIPLHMAAVLVLLMLVVGYVSGGLLLSAPGRGTTPTPSPGFSAVKLPRPSTDSSLAVYDGATRTILPYRVTSTCEDSNPEALADYSLATVWRCSGRGEGDVLRFQLGNEQDLVGLRLASGNLYDPHETDEQRQLLTVRWRFSDGSWFDQSMTGKPSSFQEVLFPTITASSVELEIVATTDPSSARGRFDAISIGQVEFLGRR